MRLPSALFARGIGRYIIASQPVCTKMVKKLSLISWLSAATALAQVQGFVPVTQQMLENPSPDDWLMYSRTYDAQRYSPLKQITRQNVGQLRMVWTRGIGAGTTETIRWSTKA